MEAVAGGAGEAETCSPRLHGSPCPPALVTGQGAVRICRAVGSSGPDVEPHGGRPPLPVRAGSRRAGIRGESAAGAQRAAGMRGRRPPGGHRFKSRLVMRGDRRRVARPRQRCACFSLGRSARSVGSAPMRGRASAVPVLAAVAAASVGRAQGGKPLNCHGRRPQLQGGDRAFPLTTSSCHLHPCWR